MKQKIENRIAAWMKSKSNQTFFRNLCCMDVWLSQNSISYMNIKLAKHIYGQKVQKQHLLWDGKCFECSFIARHTCFLFCLAAGICKDCTGKIKNTITRKLKYINNQSIEQLNAFGFALQPLLPKNRIGEPFHQLDLLSPNRPPRHPPTHQIGQVGNWQIRNIHNIQIQKETIPSIPYIFR